jgi:DNA-binding IclR family transcriptional regulator
VPLRLDDGTPIAAISVSSIGPRMDPARRSEIAAAVQREVAAMSEEFRPFLTVNNARDLVRSAVA